MTRRYRAISTEDFEIKELDVMSALYDRRSGQTHLVAPPIPEMLAVMQGRECEPREIVENLAALYDLPAEEDHVASIEARLAELQKLGLVEAVA